MSSGPKHSNQVLVGSRRPAEAAVAVTVVRDAPPTEGTTGVLSNHVIGLHMGGPARVVHRRDDGRFEGMFHPGQLTSIPAGCSVTCRTDRAVSFAHVHLTSDLVRSVAEDLGLRRQEALPSVFQFEDPVARQVMACIADESGRTGGAATLFLESAAVLLIQRMYRRSEGEVRRGLSRHMVSRVLELLEEDMSSSPSLLSIAATLGMSPRNLTRMYKRATGESVHDSFSRIRLRRARELLSTTEEGIVGVALRLGFANPSQFAAFFRRHEGMTPSRFRALNRA